MPWLASLEPLDIHLAEFMESIRARAAAVAEVWLGNPLVAIMPTILLIVVDSTVVAAAAMAVVVVAAVAEVNLGDRCFKSLLLRKRD